MTGRGRIAALAAAGVGLALAAACTSGQGGGATSGPTSGHSSRPSDEVNDIVPTPRSKVTVGGKMVWAISETIPNFNIYEVDGSLQDNQDILSALLPAPFHFDAAGRASVNTDYFTSIKETSSRPLTIEYKINPKARWSDGTPITWQDLASLAKASNGRSTKYDIATSQGYDQIASVTKGVSDRDAVVTFAMAFTDWQSLFQPLVPRSLTLTSDRFNKSWTARPLITAGPFRFESMDEAAQIYRLVRDPRWWGQRAMLDSIEFAVYTDPSAAVQALGQHEVDYDAISAGDVVGNVQAVKRYTGISIREATGSNYRQFTLNTRDPLLSDVKVRQAIVLGTDRATITTAMIGGLGGNPTPLQNHFFMQHQPAYTATCASFCAYDPTAAKRLLESDGWTIKAGYFEKAGKQLSIAITIPADTPNAKAEAELAQNSLRMAGIKLTLKTVPTNDFVPKYVATGNFQLTTFTWVGTQFPVGGALSVFKYDPKNIGQNYGLGGSTRINSLLARAARAPNAAEESRLANTASRQMWANAAWLPLYQRRQVTAVRSDLVNIGASGFADLRYQDIGYRK